jgi:hypothetical protein
MESGEQTIRNPPEGGGKKLPKKECDPYPEFDSAKPISLYAGPDKKRREYALTCAAHHLIPAGASLKKSTSLLKWIKKGKQIKADIGYNVNGLQNGVWLPGNYAMRGIWGSLKDGEDMPAGAGTDGPLSEKPQDNKFYYAVKAMILVGGQFHDAHPKYSEFVLDCLNKIATAMVARKGFCPDCKDLKEPFPPPYKLALLLNGVSKRMKGYLVGGPGGWREDLVTSRFAAGYVLKYRKDKAFRPK